MILRPDPRPFARCIKGWREKTRIASKWVGETEAPATSVEVEASLSRQLRFPRLMINRDLGAPQVPPPLIIRSARALVSSGYC